ncbi:MAG: phosphoribosylanthranilate isomerase [Candidatus Sulfotelmatobacter sp.]
MTWVKICGTTNLEDALIAVDAGADAVGFVFYEKSPRKISVEAAREIVEKLPESVEKVGVFVNEKTDTVLKASQEAGLNAVQLYPDRKYSFSALDGDFVPRIGRRIYVAIPPRLVTRKRLFGFALAKRNHVSAMFLDSGNGERPGGTGKEFDWKNVAPIAEGMRRMDLRLVVAGGLTPQNVGEAMNILKPWGVDVASGVEIRPGKKDSEKVRAFVRAVREMDRKTS